MTPDEENRLASTLLITLQKASQDSTNAACEARSVATLALDIVQVVKMLHVSYRTPNHSHAHTETWRSVNPAYPHISALPWRAVQAVYLFVCTVTPESNGFQMASEFNFQAFERALNMTKSFMQNLVKQNIPASKRVDEQAQKIADTLACHTGAYALKRVTVQDAVIQLAGLSYRRNERPDTVHVFSRDASSVVLSKNDRKIRVTFVHEEC